MIFRPDVLVLGGGGVLGERWMMGVLAGIEDATGFDLRRCEYFVGTSAGSIVAARLAAGMSAEPAASRAERSSRRWRRRCRTRSARRRSRPRAAPANGRSLPGRRSLPVALAAARPPGALVRAGLLSRAPRPNAHARRPRRSHRAPGRALRRAAARSWRSTATAAGGSCSAAPGAPYATVARAVQASCAVPWIFAPVTIGGEEYVDGGVWSATNLDVAPAGRDTHVLCLNPTAGDQRQPTRW